MQIGFWYFRHNYPLTFWGGRGRRQSPGTRACFLFIFCCRFFLRTFDQHGQQFDAAFRNIRTRSEDGRCAMFVQVIIILRRNNAADGNEDILAAAFPSSSTRAGSKVLWPAAREEKPTIWTSLSTAS